MSLQHRMKQCRLAAPSPRCNSQAQGLVQVAHVLSGEYPPEQGVELSIQARGCGSQCQHE